MSVEMITQLPTVTSASLTDIIYAVQGYVSPSNPGLSVQETLQQVLNLVNSNILLNFAGNPNGNVAGTAYQSLCWDTTDNFLWICTTTGTSSGAVWKPIVGALTNGQLVIGSTGNAPAHANLTAGPGISIANSAGGITISGTASSIGWNVVTSNTVMVAENGYIANTGSPINLTLPSTAAVGTALAAMNLSTGGFTIVQGSGQNIRVGTSISTTGAGGSVASSAQGDSIYLICVVANTSWMALGGVQGAFTVT